MEHAPKDQVCYAYQPQAHTIQTVKLIYMDALSMHMCRLI